MKFRDADHQHVGLRKHPDFRFQSTLGGVVLCLQGRVALILHLHFSFSIVQSQTLCGRRPLKKQLKGTIFLDFSVARELIQRGAFKSDSLPHFWPISKHSTLEIRHPLTLVQDAPILRK